MKKLLLLVVVALAAVGGRADSLGELSAEWVERLKKAVTLVDGGFYDAAIEDFNKARELYPDNYAVNYELAVINYMKGDYKEAIKYLRHIEKSPDVEPGYYQIYGNALDMLGKPADALKIYRKGLKKFPEAGELYLESGNIELHREEYEKALEWYERGIEADPDFASDYYRAAMILFDSNIKVWSLIYAEAEILLAPTNNERRNYMATLMTDCYKDNITVDIDGDKVEMKTTLAPGRSIGMPPSGEPAFDFCLMYETAAQRYVMQLGLEKTAFTASLTQLTQLRRDVLEAFTVAGDIFGGHMYLFDYQRRVLEAGHWEAYNLFLFAGADIDGMQQWYDENRVAFNEFVEWMEDNPFVPDTEHTVSYNAMNRYVRPFTYTRFNELLRLLYGMGSGKQ